MQPWAPLLPSSSAVRATNLILNPPSLSLFTALGAAYGTAKSGTGIAAMSVMRPDLIMKSVIPVVMAGIIAIYGLVVSVLIGNGRKIIVCLSVAVVNNYLFISVLFGLK